MRALTVLATLMAVALGTASATIDVTVPPSQRVTRKTTIPVGFNASTENLVTGWKDMYYTQQSNGELIAVNLTSNTVAWRQKFRNWKSNFGLVALRCYDGYLFAQSADTGTSVFGPDGSFLYSVMSVSLLGHHSYSDGTLYWLDCEATTSCVFNLMGVQSGFVQQIRHFPASSSVRFSTLFNHSAYVYNYAAPKFERFNFWTNTTEWTLTFTAPRLPWNFEAEDEQYIYVSVKSTGFDHDYYHQFDLEVYAQPTFDGSHLSTPAFVQRLAMASSPRIGYSVVPPVVSNGVLTYLNGSFSGDRTFLLKANLSTGAYISAQELLRQTESGGFPTGIEPHWLNLEQSSPLPKRQLILWAGAQFVAISYPLGVPTTLRGQFYAPYNTYVLGSSGLILGTRQKSFQVKYAVTGDHVMDYQMPTNTHKGTAGLVYVREDKNEFVITNGDNVEVFSFA